MVDTSNNSPPAGESDAPPVTLCCAATDEATVRQAADALMARGHQVQLAIGVDADESVVLEAIEAQQGRGLYVLCRGSALDRGAVDHLREVLRGRDVPFGRTLTLAVDTQGARELEERIVSVLRRMVTGRHDVRARTWGSSTPSPGPDDPETAVHSPNSDPAIVLQGLGTAPDNADPFAATQVEGDGIMPPEYTGVDHTAVAPGATSDHSSAPAPLPIPGAGSAPIGRIDSAPLAAMGSAPRSTPGMPVATPSAGSAPLSSPGASSPTSETTSDDGLPNEGSSAPVVAPSMPGVSAAMGPYATPGADDSSADFEPPLTVGGRLGRALGSPAGLAAVIGGLAVVVLVVVLANALGGDGEDQGQAANDKAPPQTKSEAKADGAKADEAKADEAKADEPEADEPEADEPEDTAAAAEPTDTAEPEPSEPIAAAAAPDEDPPEVVEALKNREVRAIDIFLVAPERKGTLAYESAVDYCNALEVASLTGWRVPTIGELNTVATARMLGKSIYWSSTLGDAFGDLMLVLNTKKDRISVVTKGWDGAKITCIRPRRP